MYYVQIEHIPWPGVADVPWSGVADVCATVVGDVVVEALVTVDIMGVVVAVSITNTVNIVE
jgi:hypothetical protein